MEASPSARQYDSASLCRLDAWQWAALDIYDFVDWMVTTHRKDGLVLKLARDLGVGRDSASNDLRHSIVVATVPGLLDKHACVRHVAGEARAEALHGTFWSLLGKSAPQIAREGRLGQIDEVDPAIADRWAVDEPTELHDEVGFESCPEWVSPSATHLACRVLDPLTRLIAAEQCGTPVPLPGEEQAQWVGGLLKRAAPWLTDLQRRVLELRVVEGERIGDIARATRLSATTVRAAYKSALVELGRQLPRDRIDDLIEQLRTLPGGKPVCAALDEARGRVRPRKPRRARVPAAHIEVVCV